MTREVAILGSGFGLYGYLPALLAAGATRIVLPRRYEATLLGRSELSPFVRNVHWVTDDDSALQVADTVVFALPPAIQLQRCLSCLGYPNVNRYLLEKPLAPDPAAASTLLQALSASRKVFRIGYSFRFTRWGAKLLDRTWVSPQTRRLSVVWTFCAHHFRYEVETWKRFDSAGGGVVRFYGIHLIALLAEMGYDGVSSSRVVGHDMDQTEGWDAIFTGPSMPDFVVTLDTRVDARQFRIEELRESGVTVLVAQMDPFFDAQSPPAPPVDDRVLPLTTLCHSLFDDSSLAFEWYEAAVNLWDLVEKSTSYQPRAR